MKRKISVKRRLNSLSTRNQLDFQTTSANSSQNVTSSATANVTSGPEIDYMKLFGEKGESPVSVMSASSLNSIRMCSMNQNQRQPQNLSEWQLNLVLQRANLLQYYNIFISQGGDDVQQLLEAGEEEFLEIMALVGMASKPLHVRRLQKALQEYSSNPIAFQLIAFQKSGLSPPPGLALAAASMPQLFGTPFSPSAAPSTMVSPLVQFPGATTTSAAAASSLASINLAQAAVGASPELLGNVRLSTNSPNNDWHQIPPLDNHENIMEFSNSSPVLSMEQINRLVDCAQTLLGNVPDFETNGSSRKQQCFSEFLLGAADFGTDRHTKLEYFRRYAKIYGKPGAAADSLKLKGEKVLNLHEVSMNEAAAQLCALRPSLLARRDDLFRLAKQVMREAGFQWTKMSMNGGIRTSPAESLHSEFEGSPVPSTSTASEMSPEGIFAENGRRRPSLSILNGFPNKKKRCLKEIGDELQKVGREQDVCKLRVDDASDLGELHAIQRDLQRLTQRQMELSDEQADALHAIKQEAQKQRSIFENANISGVKSES